MIHDSLNCLPYSNAARNHNILCRSLRWKQLLFKVQWKMAFAVIFHVVMTSLSISETWCYIKVSTIILSVVVVDWMVTNLQPFTESKFGCRLAAVICMVTIHFLCHRWTIFLIVITTFSLNLAIISQMVKKRKHFFESQDGSDQQKV